MAELIRGMPMEEYQAIKALSAGGIHTLVEECPARFWHDSPWNGSRERDNRPEFDIGTALHLAVLEPHEMAERIVAIPQDDYRTKEARDLRDGAYAAGKTPLKPKELVTVLSMATAIEQSGVAQFFRGGDAEVTLLWNWNGVPCKARADYLSGNAEIVTDPKTAVSAHPEAVARKVYAEGWHSRVAWYREAVTAATGKPPSYRFVVIEKDPPHIIQAYEIDDRAIAWGEQIVRRGLRLFAECMESGHWPGYGEGTIKLPLPTWAEYRLADRDAAGEFGRISVADARRSMEWMEP